MNVPQKCWFHHRVNGRLEKRYFNTPESACLRAVQNMLENKPAKGTDVIVYWAHNTHRAFRVSMSVLGSIYIVDFPYNDKPLPICSLPGPDEVEEQ